MKQTIHKLKAKEKAKPQTILHKMTKEEFCEKIQIAQELRQDKGE